MINCPEQLLYVIRQGDNLYQLSKYYQTTVPMILAHNPNIDPYNLQIGEQIVICPGENFITQPTNPNPPACPNPSMQISLVNSMRLAWVQHVYWTRMLLISIADRLMDQSAVTDRLLQNPNDLAKIFAKYYSANIANTIAQLLTEHLQIGAALITALRDGKATQANDLNRQWYANADKMAEAFDSINPYLNYADLQKMLYSHLDLTKQEVAMRFARNYPADVEAFNKVEQEAMSMSDYFTSGLMQQFPQRFN